MITGSGVAWRVGDTIIAVAGDTIITRNPDKVWRAGTYATAGDAEREATRMTERIETTGGTLDAGPAVFIGDADHRAILAALGIPPEV